MKERVEVAETTVTIIVNPNILNIKLGNVLLNTPYDTERVPLSYTAHIATTVIKTKIKGGFGYIANKLNIFDEYNTDTQESILKVLSEFPTEDYSLTSTSHVYPGIVDRFKNANSQFNSYGINPLKEIQVSTVI